MCTVYRVRKMNKILFPVPAVTQFAGYNLDYTQSVFFLSLSNIEQNARECTRAKKE